MRNLTRLWLTSHRRGPNVGAGGGGSSTGGGGEDRGSKRRAPGPQPTAPPHPRNRPRQGGGASRAPVCTAEGWWERQAGSGGAPEKRLRAPGTGRGIEGGRGRREEGNLRPAETTSLFAEALHGPAPRPGAVGKLLRRGLGTGEHRERGGGAASLHPAVLPPAEQGRPTGP